MARVWLVGATGFLGAAILDRLVAAGHDVVPVSSRGGSAAGLEVAPCDVLDAAAVGASARGCDVAVLAMGKVSRDRGAAAELHRVHVLGTRSALEGSRRAGVRKVIYVSTSGTIAASEDPAHVARETDPAPALIERWPYYRSKLWAEREALAHQGSAFEVVVVNPSLLLGPGDARGSSTGDVLSFLRGELPAIPSGGIAFVDVRDAAAAVVSAMSSGRGGERYLLNAANMPLAEFFERLSALSSVPLPRLRLPRGRAVVLGAHRALAGVLGLFGGRPAVDEVSLEMAQCHWYCDASKARRELGFQPRDPELTLRDTIADLLERAGRG